ncbi:MAG TPA: Asp-tRNA(Asn)/Glu-tRNA(Gln) amidotransferase GatCAB subunit B, partial [Chitinophagaceae bacterium]|nr:Asp-tRNA(Asn)/Glu-tRNA(Gln) amidotransferase GatCAB subunit B [Chitinophagaceae bacterium]
VSVRLRGEEKMGTKVEVKNLNSIRNVKRAIEAEATRLIEILESGGHVQQQTRSYDAGSNTTFAIRDKEDADDYRYFPEPDLTPFHLSEAFIENIKNQIPTLPQEKAQHFIHSYQLSEADAQWLAAEKDIAEYFEQIANHTKNYKAAANWIQGPIQTWMNENEKEINAFPISPAALASLIQLIDDGQISYSAASGKLFDTLIKTPDTAPGIIAKNLDLIQQSNADELTPVVDKVLEKFADKVVAYQKGKKGLLALFTGEVMKLTKGKADPKIVTKILNEKLKK